jgi:uncharacterized protein (DUF1015 family)
MLEVRGFRGLTFDSAKVGPQDNVITPPYDVISPEEREQLAALSPYNLVHVNLPQDRPGQSRYEVAGALLDQWASAGILVQDREPAFYLLRQHFVDLHGVAQVRKAFFGVVRLPEAGDRYILGHERTFDKPVEDRLALTRATRANLGAVFGLYSDPGQRLAEFLRQMNLRPAAAAANTIDGVFQEFWRVPYDPEITEFFQDQTLYIADGHHRFKTAGIYRDEIRAQRGIPALVDDENAPHEFVLMGFVALEDPGLKIYPPHRLLPMPADFDAARFLKALEPWFLVEPVPGDLPGCVEQAAKNAGKPRMSAWGAPEPVDEPFEHPCVMGLAIHGHGDYLLTLRDIDRADLLGEDRGPAWRDLDVAVLHRGIIERILGVPEGAQFVYEKNVVRAMDAVRCGDAGIGFILRPTRPDQICACAEASEPMPQKSTYFFPKLPSGGVIHRLC